MAARFQWPIRRSPASDPQRYRLYRMESEAIGALGIATLTRRSIRGIYRRLGRQYGIAVPVIQYRDLGVWAAECNESAIIFSTSRESRTIIVAAHEFGHHLHNHLAGDADHESHGPQFMACYMSVLDTARILPVCAMRAICEQYRLRYNDPGDRNSLTALRRAVKGPA